MEEIQSREQSSESAKIDKRVTGGKESKKGSETSKAFVGKNGGFVKELLSRSNRGEREFLKELLKREEQRGWNESKTVIVDIDNSRKLTEDNSDKKDTKEIGKLAQAKQITISDKTHKEDDKKKEKNETYRKLNDNTDHKSQGQTKKEQSGRRNSLPTFGGTPLKLATRLPYFSYFGKARNVDLVTASDRKVPEQQIRYNIDDGREVSTTSGSSSSQDTFSVTRTSKIPVLENRKVSLRDEKKNQRGFSNISNLFPGRPMSNRTGWLTSRISPPGKAQSSGNLLTQQSQQPATRVASGQYKSNSNLSSKQTGLNVGQRRQQQVGRQGGSNQSPTNPLSSIGMRRQNSAGLLTNTKGKNYLSPNYGNSTSRPNSTLGYGNTLTKNRQRISPKSNRDNYNWTGNSGPISPQMANNYEISIVDPDCPVHGDNSPEPPYTRGFSRSVQNLTSDIRGEQEVDDDGLLYADMNPYVQQGYYDNRSPYGNYLNSGSLYSPISPVNQMSRSGSGALYHPSSGNQRNRSAYYNNSTRFGLYQSPSVTPGTLGHRPTSLAPPNEQLRRILGYQPPAAKPRPVHLHPQWAYSRPFIHLQGPRSPSPILDADGELDLEATYRPPYVPYNQLLDSQAVRAVDFHPTGEVYAIGSNSRTLRICAYPADHELRHFNEDHVPSSPRVLFKFLQVHRGSIYCVSFNSSGQLLATGSNDQTIHLVKYNPITHSADGDEYRLTMHDGTIRDLCFIDDPMNGSSLLLSAGGGDNKIYVTDCDTVTPFQSMAGHTQTVMALHHWNGANFISASYDRTIRMWDLRTRACTSIISAPPTTIAGKWAGPGAPVCAVKVDPTGRLMVSGHSDSSCMLYDMRASRIIQTFKPHEDELRTVSFSPKSYYLLTGGYDGRLVLTDLQGDLSQPLPSVCVAECGDKIVQSKWHPSDFTFVTTCADRTATLWALPTE